MLHKQLRFEAWQVIERLGKWIFWENLEMPALHSTNCSPDGPDGPDGETSRASRLEFSAGKAPLWIPSCSISQNKVKFDEEIHHQVMFDLGILLEPHNCPET